MIKLACGSMPLAECIIRFFAATAVSVASGLVFFTTLSIIASGLMGEEILGFLSSPANLFNRAALETPKPLASVAGLLSSADKASARALMV